MTFAESTDDEGPVARLDEDRCWEMLQEQQLGRLVTRVGEVLDIFPVNYIVDGRSVLFRTAPGSKLFELTVNDEVLFEVDGHTDAEAWSVILRGSARVLDTTEEVQRADQLGLKPWIPTLKYSYVRVEPASLSGRYFARGPEPDRYGVQQY